MSAPWQKGFKKYNELPFRQVIGSKSSLGHRGKRTKPTMLDIVRKIKKVLDRSLEFLVAFLMGVLVVDVSWQVFTRYVMGHQASWTEELAVFLLMWVGLLGASVALNRGAHLGIDYFVGKLKPKTRVYTELAVFASTGLFALFVMMIGGGQLVRLTLVREQISPAMGIQMGYVYMAIPISGFFLLLYSLEFLVERVLVLARDPAGLEGFFGKAQD